ncbi:MAG: hypothetical protein JWR54_1622 [Mucilaginibacter sp.]|nr:hypothetical protein [Mucilaginibacter sp.]
MKPRLHSLFKLVTGLFLLSFSCCCILSNGFASGRKDSVIIAQYRTTNTYFNQVYRENLPAAFYGNEYGNPTHDLLTADINPNVILLSSAHSRFFIVLAPRIQMRLLSEYHSPVKSPSYMPGASIFTRVNNDDMHPKFLSLSYSHHSNGQEGLTLDHDGVFNRDDGKFTTNFYTLNYYFGKRYITDVQAKSQSAFVGLEVHSGLFGLGYSKQLKGKYGFVRTNGSWFYDIMRDRRNTSDHYLNHQRLRFDLTYIWDRLYDYSIVKVQKRLNVSVKYYYQFGFMENVALMVGAGYRGQDPYNIYFQDSYPYVAIGLASGVSFDIRKRRHYNTN